MGELAVNKDLMPAEYSLEYIINKMIGRDALEGLNIRERIEYIESIMCQYEQVTIPVKHLFYEGIYARQIFIPRDTLLTSRIHKMAQIDVMSMGAMSIITNEGIMRIQSPFIGMSPPGMKRLGYALEDTIWTSIHFTEERDIDKIEKILYAKSYEELESFEVDQHRKDFQRMLIEYGISCETVRAQSENTEDQIAIPLEEYGLKISNSLIEGLGLFATFEMQKGRIIAPARINGMRTEVGRYTNHSSLSNAEMIFLGESEDIGLIAKKYIEKNEEVTIDYRASLKLLGVIKEEIPCQQY